MIKMLNETEKPIEKPWAVYGWSLGSWGIGKIVNRGHTLDIQYCEGQHYPPECWDPKWVKRFDNPVKAMAYFKVHVHDSYYTKEEIIESFLRNFPSEETNLEKFLAQTSPKCTPTVEEDWGPFGKHPHLKDGPIGPHPNKKY